MLCVEHMVFTPTLYTHTGRSGYEASDECLKLFRKYVKTLTLAMELMLLFTLINYWVLSPY